MKNSEIHNGLENAEIRDFLAEDVNYMIDQEFILCSALDYNGTIISAARHSDCYAIIKKLFDNPVLPERDKQGFLTSRNRFVDRWEAWQIAKLNNQIRYGEEASDNGDESILISENLY
jgi:hypothetical protein